MSFTKKLITSFTLFITLVFGVLLVAQPAAALTEGFKSEACKGIDIGGGSTDCTKDSGKGINKILDKVVDIFSLVVGVAAVIVLIISGLRFITSQGESGSLSSARNSIIYALVGLVVVALAQVIVKFVLKQTTTCPAGQVENSRGVCVEKP